MPDYSVLKLLHMIAAALVVIGLMVSATAVANPPPAQRLAALRRWDRFVTGPALGLLWILGITLALEGHWFASGAWLPAKMVLALVLSGLHGMQAGGMKRLARGESAPSFLRFSPYLVAVLVIGVVALVETKPF